MQKSNQYRSTCPHTDLSQEKEREAARGEEYRLGIIYERKLFSVDKEAIALNVMSSKNNLTCHKTLRRMGSELLMCLKNVFMKHEHPYLNTFVRMTGLIYYLRIEK
jgi:hypothetical protein